MHKLGVLTHHSALLVLCRHLCSGCARMRLGELLSVLLRERLAARCLRPCHCVAMRPRDCGSEAGRFFAVSLVKGALLFETAVFWIEAAGAIERCGSACARRRNVHVSREAWTNQRSAMSWHPSSAQPLKIVIANITTTTSTTYPVHHQTSTAKMVRASK